MPHQQHPWGTMYTSCHPWEMPTVRKVICVNSNHTLPPTHTHTPYTPLFISRWMWVQLNFAGILERETKFSKCSREPEEDEWDRKQEHFSLLTLGQSLSAQQQMHLSEPFGSVSQSAHTVTLGPTSKRLTDHIQSTVILPSWDVLL